MGDLTTALPAQQIAVPSACCMRIVTIPLPPIHPASMPDHVLERQTSSTTSACARAAASADRVTDQRLTTIIAAIRDASVSAAQSETLRRVDLVVARL